MLASGPPGFARITRVASSLANSVHPTGSTRAGRCTNPVWIFRMLAAFSVIARSPCDEAIQFLLPPDCFAEPCHRARICATRWLAMTGWRFAPTRWHARVPCRFSRCSFSEGAPPNTRIFFQVPVMLAASPALCSDYACRFHLRGLRASDRRTASGSMHESRVDFSNARFLKVHPRLREPSLRTRHAGSRPPTLHSYCARCVQLREFRASDRCTQAGPCTNTV
jgi:hypothetical protein